MPMPAQKPRRSKQDYETPWEFVGKVKTVLGIKRFAVDFAASGENAKGLGWYNEQDNALDEKFVWYRDLDRADWGWLNPPFTDIAPWAAKSLETSFYDRCIAMLTPASVGSNWFNQYVHKQAYVLALNGRIAFDPEHPNWGYPKDCMLSLFGVGAGFDTWRWATEPFPSELRARLETRRNGY